MSMTLVVLLLGTMVAYQDDARFRLVVVYSGNI
jgi:hypothetical protein